MKRRGEVSSVESMPALTFDGKKKCSSQNSVPWVHWADCGRGCPARRQAHLTQETFADTSLNLTIVHRPSSSIADRQRCYAFNLSSEPSSPQQQSARKQAHPA